jgi:hypothetical protein
MNKRSKIALIALGVTTLVATALAQNPVLAPFNQALKARLVKNAPEVTYFNGEVGIEFQIKNTGFSTIGDRDVIVIDLDPSLPKLMGGVTDDRVPLSARLDMNGTVISLSMMPNGNLKATIPQSAVNWFSGNYLTVEVFDGPADANGNPTGKRIVGWAADAFL